MRGLLALLALTAAPSAQTLFYDSFTPSTGLLENYVVAHAGHMLPGPLIVMFHGSGGDHDEVVELNTNPSSCDDWDFLAQATSWPHGPDYYVLMMDGGWDHTTTSHNTYGREAFQVTVEETIQRVLGQFPILEERIYGMGFSMGGGQALSFAARHLDPTSDTMFAAVVNHTGATSVPYSYFYATNAPGRSWLEDLYELPAGETYCSTPFPFRRASALDVVPCCGGICPAYGQVNGATSIAQNLRTMPILTYYNVADSNQSLVYQNEMLDGFMVSNPDYYSVPTSANSCGQYHQWNVINSQQALFFFDLYSRQVPSSGLTLAADNTRYYDFDVLRDTSGELGTIGWDVDTAANQLTLTDLENIRALTIHTDEMGLDPLQPLTVEITIEAGAPVIVVLEDYAAAPSLVCRDNVCGPPNWSFGLLRLYESETGTHTWTVTP